MIIHFYIKYSSSFGEHLEFRFWNKAKTKSANLPLQFLNNDFWELSILEEDLPFYPYLGYECFAINNDNSQKQIFSFRDIALRKLTASKLEVFDETQSFYSNEVFKTRLSLLVNNKFKKNK